MAAENNKASSIGERWKAYHPAKSTLVWACIITAIVTITIGFTWGGWVTGGTSRSLVAEAGELSRDELATVICVQRFKAAPDSAQQMSELKAIDSSYKQRQFIEDGGWATMPGDDDASRDAASGCAAALVG
ncbi:hypothetical protein FF124_16170 [Martelella lutilitoris]|uniref:Uncharacterized protein n=1 Tax=Martelella lutilitoris TaxID=2583532 RepID=A0A5C4JMI8_9HYPH|nr:hypothetical protein [Martelella lutilitoris]TNB46540.1 hypothetical protein FF124_16170 [Martelella lutilitoris]